MKIKSKFWIEESGEKVFGAGPCMLLEMVERLGSLSRAAASLSMSYSKAWSIINRAEKILGYSLLERRSGGVGGGGSRLTDDAKALIKSYKSFIRKAEITIEEL